MSDHGGPTEDFHWESLVAELSLAADITVRVDAEIAGWLADRGDRVLVDLGCGAGGMAVAFGSAASAQARVRAVDGEPALLEATRRRAADAGLLGLETVQSDLASEIPIPPGTADVIWASGVVHHLPDEQAILDELAACLAPGGRLALGEGGLSGRSLPWDLGVGEPGLEVRLEAAQARWFAQMRRDLPGSVLKPYGWPRALRAAGLVDVTSRSFLLDLPAPLDPRAAEYVAGRLRGFLDHESLAKLVSAEDRQILGRLIDPDDVIYLGNNEDVFLLGVSTVHVGRRPGTPPAP